MDNKEGKALTRPGWKRTSSAGWKGAEVYAAQEVVEGAQARA